VQIFSHFLIETSKHDIIQSETIVEMGIIMDIFIWIQQNLFSNSILVVFLIASIGYLIGSIRIAGLELGAAGVLLVALIFGHFQITVPSVIKNFGLICFVTSVGFIAGPKFFRNFKSNAIWYVALGIIIILSGALTCIGIIYFFNVPADICTGMMTGALTSTPGLAAALEAFGTQEASIGYGIAYPFGVIGVVLFVQLTPKLMKADMDHERSLLTMVETVEKKDNKQYFNVDTTGFFAVSVAIVLGLLIAKITIPLPAGASFSLGTSGGPLISGLILGHFGHIGPVSVKADKNVLESLRELGLAMFLIGAGCEAGAGFLDILNEHGPMLFFYGALMTLIPMFVGMFFATKVMKLSLLNTLGSICGGMTSTPALGSLIKVAETDDVASAYAATYPIALVMVVLSSQFISILF